MQPRHAVPRSASPAKAPLQSRFCFASSMNLPCSYLVPFAFCGTARLCRHAPGLLALLQFLADPTNFEENAASFDAPANSFQLRGSYLLGAVRDIEKNALEFIENADERGISLFQRGLAIEPIFL